MAAKSRRKHIYRSGAQKKVKKGEYVYGATVGKLERGEKWVEIVK